MSKLFILSVLLFFCTQLSIFAQGPTSQSVAIIPFYSNGMDSVYTKTAESIFRIEFSKRSNMNIVSNKRIVDNLSDEYCFDVECAKKLGNKLGAGQVFGCNLSALGEKIIVQYFLLDLPEGKELIKDQTTSLTIEDLEMVMKRIAKSVAELEPLLEGARVGNITLNESKKSLRKASNKNIGLSFGYLYPQTGYDDSDKSLVVDFRVGYELENYTVGMLLGIRKGFAMNVYASYLFSQKDICPFIGGAFGFHWVSHTPSYDNYVERNDLNADGFEMTARTGVIAFRTYNFQVMLNLEFINTFNDYDDQAIVLTIGLL